MDELKDVPADQVGTIVGQLVGAGNSKIECEKQVDGKWTIRSQ